MIRKGCEYEDLKHNETCVHLRNYDESTEDPWLYSLSSLCESCPFTKIAQFSKNPVQSVKIDIDSLRWRVLRNGGLDEYAPVDNHTGTICELLPDVGQFGVYELSVRNGNCHFTTLIEPTSAYPAFFIVFGVLIALLIILSHGIKFWKIYRRKKLDQCVANGTNIAVSKKRVNSIDTFRGVSILLMIFVNNGAGGYAILNHTTWNGLLIGDLVFPCFLWIMGVCIPIAINSQLSRGASRMALTISIIRRSVLMFVIGVSLNTLGTDSQLEQLRIPGVLQRFSITYLTVALCFLLMTPAKSKEIQNSMLRRIQDIIILLPQWGVMLALVAIHTILIFCLPVPGCPTGYLGPGGIHKNGKYFNCTGGTTGYVDRVILSIDHIYQNPTTDLVYKSGPFDPEGILGSVTSTFQVFLGVQAGQILRNFKQWKERIIRWLGWSIVLGCVGCALHFTDVIPVNKNLWSLSFVCVSSCFAFAFLCACYIIVDVLGYWDGGPFRIPGMNALVMYIGHQVAYQMLPFHWRIGTMATHGWATVEALWSVVLWTIVAYVMHHKRTYVTL